MKPFGTARPGGHLARQAAWAGAGSFSFAFHPARPKPARTTKGKIMADSSPLAGLLDRAGNVFSVAGKLGRAFHEEHQAQRGQVDAASWDRHKPAFDEFCAALLDLRDAMQNPPDGFAPVAKPLLEAARIAKSIREAMQRPDGRTWAAYLEFFPHLNSVCDDGWQAVKEVTKARRLDDPFAFVDAPAFTLLDRFPATATGHVAFLEFVRDEVHYAADAKRQQLQRGYPNATIESMVRGIKWGEAGQRVSALSDLPTEIVEHVARVLRRELTPGTVEQIDELLTPAVCNLRDALECSKGASSAVGGILEALLAVQRELEQWNSDNSPSETGYLVEDVPAGHPLHSAVATLQRHYGGALPKPALRHWRKFLKLARNDDEDAEDEAEGLLEWVNGEIESHRADEHPDGNHAEIRTAGDLWKALDEGKTPAVVVSAISLGPPFGPNIAQPKFPKPADQSKWDVLDRALALCDAEGGDRAEAMRKLIARIALARGVDRREIINMPLAGFVEAAAGSRGSTEPKVKAGEAFLRATENDPDGKAVLQRARNRLQAFAKAMQEATDSPEYREAQEAERRQWHELADAIREAVEAAGDELESWHFARPETIEDWEHLARIVEIPAETIKTGNLTAREIFACALAWADRQTIKAKLAADTNGEVGQAEPAETASETKSPTKTKRSTERGEGRAKLIAALTKHHKYADGSCLNLEPVGNNELARLAEVSESTASAFFNKQFGGHTKYRAMCSDATRLIAALKLLNQEFSPHHLFGAKPPGEDEE